MITKKVQKSGNAYSVYLPVDWVRKIGTKEVNIVEEDTGNLSILPAGRAKKEPYEKRIHVREYDFNFVNRVIGWCYVNGYDKFTLTFDKTLSPKDMLKHRKRLDEIGLDMEVQNISENEITFYCGRLFVAPNDVFKNILDKSLNVVRAKEQSEKELVEAYVKEIWKNRHVLRRLLISSMRTSDILQEFNVKLHTIWLMDSINQYLGTAVERLVETSVSLKDLTVMKKMIGQLLVFQQEPAFNMLWNFNQSLGGLKDPVLAENMKKTERYLISWWLSEER